MILQRLQGLPRRVRWAITRRLGVLNQRLTAPRRRWVERVLWGGERRELLLIALLRRHYESLFRRQWTLAEELPHYFDHRIGSFAFATGTAHAYSYYRGYFAAEVVRPDDSLLDIGCGDGFFSRRFFSPKCSHVDAIDVDPGAIAHAARRNAAANIRYSVLDAVSDPFPRQRYDVIVFDGALGHFAPETTAGLLDKIEAALDPDGVFVGSESLGVEGHDHYQFFETLDDLASIFGKHFQHVQLRVVEYVIPTGALRREAFWRCAHQASRLDDSSWKTYRPLTPSTVVPARSHR